MIKNSLETITVIKTEIKNIVSLLVKTNFELYEIRTPDEDNEVQVWYNKKLKKNGINNAKFNYLKKISRKNELKINLNDDKLFKIKIK